MITFTRRAAIVTALLGAVHIASTPAMADEPRFDGVTIRVATWGGSWRDRIHELIGAEFEKRGGKVEYVIGNALENFNKLIVASGQEPPFDVMEFQSDLWKPLVDSGFLAPLDTPMANADGVTVKTWTLEEGIVFNAAKFAELGLPEPKRYSDLFVPELKGRIAWPDISYGPYALIGLATEVGGDELNVEPALQRLKQENLPYYYRSSVELSTKFGSGDVWAAPWHAGWAVRVSRSGLPLDIAYPAVKDKHGVVANGMVAVVKGTPVEAAARWWVERYLSTEVQTAFCSANGIAAVDSQALAAMRQDPLLAQLMLLTPEAISGAYQVNWSEIDLAAIVDQWNRGVAQ